MGELKGRMRYDEPTFTLDGAFIKREAKEALKSYFFPFSGLYAAITGKDVVFIRRDNRGRIMRTRQTKKRA